MHGVAATSACGVLIRMFPLRIPPNVRRVSMLGVVLALASACASGLGPKAVPSERPDYNRQIVRSNDAELLLNLVRLRYNDAMLFLGVGGVVAQYTYDASLNAGGQAGGGTGSASFGTAFGYGEKPTITYTPLVGEEAAARLLAPISIQSIMLFQEGGWSADRLLLLTVQRLNDVFNAPTAGGPTPSRKPDFEAFADLAERLERLREAGIEGVNWVQKEHEAPGRDQKEHETKPSGRELRFWIHQPANPRSPLAADVAAVRRALDLEPGRDEFALTEFPYKRQPSEVAVSSRSLLGVLYFLSQSVEVPAQDVQAGLVTVTEDGLGQPFDWSKITRKVMTIHSQPSHPENAYVAVQHRGSWFYIADDDHTSKATWGLLSILFALQSASAQGKAPLLTLPIGR
jgi:hypothetical protein